MVIVRKLNYRGSQGKADLQTLFDSGSTYSLIHPDYAAQLAHLEALPDPVDFESASKGSFTRAEYRITLDFYLNNLRLTDEFFVYPSLAEQAIIGATTMQKWRIKLDFEHDEVITDPRVGRVILM